MSNKAPEQEDPLLSRLDRLTAMLELALAPQLESRRTELRADPVDAAIFDLTGGEWIQAADLQGGVKKAVGAEPRTVQRRLSKLLDARLVEHRGGNRYAEYRSSGLI